jgi:hypothetical protein
MTASNAFNLSTILMIGRLPARHGFLDESLPPGRIGLLVSLLGENQRRRRRQTNAAWRRSVPADDTTTGGARFIWILALPTVAASAERLQRISRLIVRHRPSRTSSVCVSGARGALTTAMARAPP